MTGEDGSCLIRQRIVSEVPAEGFAHAKAVSALRIQCFELNRGDRPRYGDSIEGETFGGDASGEKPRLPFDAGR